MYTSLHLCVGAYIDIYGYIDTHTLCTDSACTFCIQRLHTLTDFSDGTLSCVYAAS